MANFFKETGQAFQLDFSKNAGRNEFNYERQDNITRQDLGSFPSPKNPFFNEARDNYQTYKYDYYCGADSKIYFGDVWVDDIVTITYSVNQNKVPVYGYASQLYDAVLRGQVTVQGSLVVAFKETGYLNVIHHLIESQREGARDAIQAKIKKHNILAQVGLAKFDPRLNAQVSGVTNDSFQWSPAGSPDFVRREETIEDILNNKLIGDGLSKKWLGPEYVRSRDFEDFAELLEDTIWGDSNGKPYNNPKFTIRRPDEFDYLSDGGVRVATGDNYANVLNILITFGDINDFRAEHTLVALNDVHFTGSSMIIAPDGTPIAEGYTFFARDINKSLSREMLNVSPIKLSDPEFDKVRAESIDEIEKKLRLQNLTADGASITIMSYLPINGAWKTDGLTTFDILNFAPGQDNTLSNLIETSDEVAAAEKSKLFTGIKVKSAARKAEEASYLNDLNHTLRFKSSEPILDQLITMVEREFNEVRNPSVRRSVNDRGTIDTNNSQYLIRVDVNINNSPMSVNMVLNQTIPQTRTYRVIAPTRNMFKSVEIVSREDLWKGIASDKPITGERLAADEITQYRQRQELAKAEADRRYAESLTSLGDIREKRRQELLKQEARLQSSLADLDPSDLREQLRLERQLQEVTAGLNALESSSSLDDLGVLSIKEQGKYIAALEEVDRTNTININQTENLSFLQDLERTALQAATAEEKRLAELQAQRIKAEEDRKKLAQQNSIPEEKPENVPTSNSLDALREQQAKVLADTPSAPPAVTPKDVSNFGSRKNPKSITAADRESAQRILDSATFYADKYNVDPLLFAKVLYRESGFRADATSVTGAAGLGQFTEIGIEEVLRRRPDLKALVGYTSEGYNIDAKQRNAIKTILYQNPNISIEFSAALLQSIQEDIARENKDPTSWAEIYGRYNRGKYYANTVEGSRSAAWAKREQSDLNQAAIDSLRRGVVDSTPGTLGQQTRFVINNPTTPTRTPTRTQVQSRPQNNGLLTPIVENTANSVVQQLSNSVTNKIQNTNIDLTTYTGPALQEMMRIYQPDLADNIEIKR